MIKEKINENTIGKKVLELLNIISQGMKPSAMHGEEGGAN
jgi:hypothetical protein